jgi:ATP-dependent exoDNAse (exonuclease V) alpha subunit
LKNERDGVTHDYTRRGGVAHTELLHPHDAPAWAREREKLWNEAERFEKRKNSVVAREVEIALPHELSEGQRKELTRTFGQHLVERYGVAVDVAIHKPSKDGDGRNHHAHLLMTTRRISQEGFEEKTRELDDKMQGKEITRLREAWAVMVNKALEDTGSHERVDHRSFDERGINKTPQVHLGVEAKGMKRKGQRTRQEARQKERDGDNALRGAFEKAVKNGAFRESDSREIQRTHKRQRERFRPGYARKRDEFERYLSQDEREKYLGSKGRERG